MASTYIDISLTLGHVIQDEGSSLAQRNLLDFQGAGISVADSGGKTVVTVAGGAAPVASVNTKTGVVVLDPDDLADAGTVNKFTTAAEISKLAGIEALAEVNPTNAETKTAYEANADTNAFTDAEQTKLTGIEALAEVNPDVVPQAEAEAGTATTERIWTAERVKQAIAALASGQPTKDIWFSPGSDSNNQDNYSVRNSGSTAQTYFTLFKVN